MNKVVSSMTTFPGVFNIIITHCPFQSDGIIAITVVLYHFIRLDDLDSNIVYNLQRALSPLQDAIYPGTKRNTSSTNRPGPTAVNLVHRPSNGHNHIHIRGPNYTKST